MFLQPSTALFSLLLLKLSGPSIALPTEQIPLQNGASDNIQAVRTELIKAEIIPTVVDDFLPSLTLSVSWSKKEVQLGNTIKPKHVQDAPSITLHDETSPDSHATSNLTYVVTLTDPDAPSRDNPKWSEMCHWIVANVSLSQDKYSIFPIPFINLEEMNKVGEGLDEVMEWKPPGPPPKTGKHRYVFLVYAPRNGTQEPLHLTKPKDRQHWGTGEERGGVREWAKENELVPVGANFMYSLNKKQ
ncbi:PEBP-like protein [Melanomma pulvis-pyrius CBS 109.77]|uniref:PEBP-like protein n=1 Tax=Melanomma pulvis-pyrius CBS 109.77 TaxID=1314802 RepID=A0A6A6X421_9PLEO|nr:PEBP-like protein [Melanomma pulvis-pyrius CBS 109.77]